MLIGLSIAAGVVLVALLVALARYRLQRAQVEARNTYTWLSFAVRRRHDLVPSVIAAVRTYSADYETSLGHLATAEEQARALEGSAGQADAEAALTTWLRSALETADGIPELSTNDGYRALYRALGEAEDRMAFARDDYNRAAGVYNARLRRFPINLVGKGMGLERVEPFTPRPVPAT